MFFPLHVYKHLEIQQTIIVNKKEEERNFEQRTAKTRNKQNTQPCLPCFPIPSISKTNLK